MSWRVCAERIFAEISSCARRKSLIISYRQHLGFVSPGPARNFSTRSSRLQVIAGEGPRLDFLSEYKKSFLVGSFPDFHFGESKKNEEHIGKVITVQGFLGKRRDLSEKLSFIKLALARENGNEIQVVSRVEDNAAPGITTTSQDAHIVLKNTRPYSAVLISAVLEQKRQSRRKSSTTVPYDKFSKENLELVLQDIICLATFPEDVIISDDAKFGPENRHLQLRFDPVLKKNLRFRDRILRQCRLELEDFQEIETPILFKSTPEGAREFLVPTRKSGYAYALPQSPQQYKQILMASGVYRYFQIAKCFRDEDLRADRQPEFTQVDLEMAFSNGEMVMKRVETFVQGIFNRNLHESLAIHKQETAFPRMTYDDAMNKFGSDKPDLRIPEEIRTVDTIMPKDLIGMVTSLPNPVVECWRFRLNCKPSVTRSFVKEFMDSSEAVSFQQNPDGAPGIFIYDSRQPLGGMQAFGFEGTEALKDLYLKSNSNFGALTSTSSRSELPAFDSAHPSATDHIDEPFEDGDLLIVQARPRVRHWGGSTALGRLRVAIHEAAISKGLIDQDRSEFLFLWITDFPLFTPNNETDPGQGGTAGFSATHHPFTAPKTAADVELLVTNPLDAIADHYDLVLNGVELGGGSKRIHNSEMQHFVMKEILEMSDERLEDFSHLFRALRAGCPPHAGIALGLDRLIALMLGLNSVRDVIAFPKSGNGEDLLVKSPSPMTPKQLKTYHLTTNNLDLV